MMEGQERTEQATPRRREDARKKGQVARSFELTAMLSLLIGVLALQVAAGPMVRAWRAFAEGSIARASTFQMSIPMVQTEITTAGISFLGMMLPLLLVLGAASLAANMLQVGFLFSSEALAFDFSKLNPLQGLVRMFSMRSFVEMMKSLLKAGVVTWVIIDFFKTRVVQALEMLQDDFDALGPTIFRLAMALLLRAVSVLLVIAIADYAWQRWQFEKSLRMTKEQVKEEYKRTEGDPMVKGRIRGKQRMLARQRMMAAVPTATVVVTNPTHLAVALRYDPASMDAPLVVAKGQRLVAARIKEIAKEHGVPVMENKPVARALYDACEVNESIPLELYRAVAEIIAFVMKQSGRGV
ncbi:MAG: Flagellar biosynthetic protein FlhB [bacterium ADurb.Bin429]|nr:MAG: Flagellar biosynthetic protein FlhB [bacterium ADurb.Bin429]